MAKACALLRTYPPAQCGLATFDARFPPGGVLGDLYRDLAAAITRSHDGAAA